MSRADCCPICGREIRANVNAAFFGGKPYHFSCWVGESGQSWVAAPAPPVPATTGSPDKA